MVYKYHSWQRVPKILFYEDPTSIALQFYISGWLMFSDFGCRSFSQEMAKAIFHFFF